MSHDSSGCADARSAACPCSRCDLLLGLDGVHVEQVERDDGVMVVTVSSPAAATGCPVCGVVAVGRGRRRVLSRRARGDPGADRVAATGVAVRRRRLCAEDVRGAAAGPGRPARVDHQASRRLGGRASAARARHHRRDRPAAGGVVEDGVAGGRTRTGAARRRRVPVRGRHDPRRRRAHLASRRPPPARPEGTDRDGRPDP